jgi:hypothetical protein
MTNGTAARVKRREKFLSGGPDGVALCACVFVLETLSADLSQLRTGSDASLWTRTPPTTMTSTSYMLSDLCSYFSASLCNGQEIGRIEGYSCRSLAL